MSEFLITWPTGKQEVAVQQDCIGVEAYAMSRWGRSLSELRANYNVNIELAPDGTWASGRLPEPVARLEDGEEGGENEAPPPVTPEEAKPVDSSPSEVLPPAEPSPDAGGTGASDANVVAEATPAEEAPKPAKSKAKK